MRLIRQDSQVPRVVLMWHLFIFILLRELGVNNIGVLVPVVNANPHLHCTSQ